VLPVDGFIPVGRAEVDPLLLAELGATADRVAWWKSHLTATYEIMIGR